MEQQYGEEIICDPQQVEKVMRQVRLCAYCEEAPAEGYVAAYKAWVCEDCYEDHHGHTY